MKNGESPFEASGGPPGAVKSNLFVDGAAEAQRGLAMCPRTHSFAVMVLNLQQPLSSSRAPRFRDNNPVSPVTGFPGGSDGEESACNAGDASSISGSGISPRERNGNPFQYSCPENFMGRGVWQAAVHGVTKSQTQLCN